MEKIKIYQGGCELKTTQSEVSGQFVEIDNEKYYQIENYHKMPDFFISIVSDSDHWMFISSNGSLSAGRKDRENALFPYYTVDKIHDYKGLTGSATHFLVNKNGKTYLWEPFTNESVKYYTTIRNLYKSIYGNKIIFEEINADLGLRFRYGWYNSEEYGFIKKSSLSNLEDSVVGINMLDGIKNIIPHGIGYAFQNEYSNLTDAYKKSERVEGGSLGLFMLSAIPVDRAEPSEALKTTTVWSAGFGDEYRILLSDKQVSNYINNQSVKPEYDVRAARGAYFINAGFSLDGEGDRDWYTIAEINQDGTSVANLNAFINSTKNIEERLNDDINKGTVNLKKMVAFADGFQMTNTDLCYARHYSNTLFNIMRGGVFADNYRLNKSDFKSYVWQINRLLAKEYQSWLGNLPEEISYSALLGLAEKTGDADLLRLCYEYLPLTFSRRHGDPSRPWNMFSIETKTEDGEIKYYYAGNWRDIFQNWEALCYSYPEFIEGIISKFVNASTIDGYNPYRIMRDGIDWESPDPNDPWSYIGYWGDHQIIYLQKLLEISNDFHPGKLDRLLSSEIFTYANVPYRIKPYNEIYQDPKDTVVFNEELNSRIKTEAEHLGADASLLKNKSGEEIYKVNLTEKVLVTLLSKLSNFIPEAGIWMNTQRPEWNDANNALVGNGTSMVTLYYLRRFLNFWEKKLSDVSISSIDISEEIATLMGNMHSFFIENTRILNGRFSDADRKKFADFLGQTHAKYRNEVYTYSFSGEKKPIHVKDLVAFIRVTLKYLDHSIRVNKRSDGLYHTYNLISLQTDGITIRNLYEMLEGQVAVLSSGFLSTGESLEVLDALKNSLMFRKDQYSYMLYPDRVLPRFTEKNWVPEHLIEESNLLKKLLLDNETSIIQKDDVGEYHFNGNFRNANSLEVALDDLRIGSYSHLVEEEKEKILGIYESVFDHQSFTGRSGTFYGYEGLGSIYWHMVSKLLLATQECYFRAISEGASQKLTGQFESHYYEIKAGIGLYKTPDLYGAFPTDAYSHTPSNAGVKQPGLTGQVKEDIISRLGEMGVLIEQGKIMFETALLNKDEILNKPQVFEYYSMDGENCRISLKEDQIGFTFCQVPVVYTFSDEEKITVSYLDGSHEEIQDKVLNQRISSLIFKRSGEVKLVEVKVKKIKHVS